MPLYQNKNYWKMAFYVICSTGILLASPSLNAQKDTSLRWNKQEINTLLNYKGGNITKIKRDSNIQKITINQLANFYGATIKPEADFGKVVFLETADFQHVKFDNNAAFSGAYFSKMSLFFYSKFSRDAYFSNDTFSEHACFSMDTFLNNVHFVGTTFKSEAKFASLKLTENTQFFFNEARLPSYIDFSHNPKIYNEIDLTAANFNDPSHYDSHGLYMIHHINLYKSDISKFHLDYFHFNLWLPDSTDEYDKREISGDEKDAIYEALLNNFKARGQSESLEKLDIEYHNFKHRHFIVRRWWNKWGYRKERIFYWAGFFLACFTIMTFFNIDKLTKIVYAIDNIPQLPSFKITWNSMSRYRLLRGRLWYSFIYTSTIFFKLTLKLENLKFQRWTGALYVIIVYTLGVVCIAYMANFVLDK